jgi:hypothetical protein
MQTYNTPRARFVVRAWPGDFGREYKYAIWDREREDLALSGIRKQALRNLSAYQANRSANILNIVERGGCGRCARKLASLADPQAIVNDEYGVVCIECAIECAAK